MITHRRNAAMRRHSFQSPALRRTWIFDLDNTLFDASEHVFPFLHDSMKAYIQAHLDLDETQAAQLRRHYWLRYGATLDGLVRHHGTDPQHFLQSTHRLPDWRRMVRCLPGLRDALRRLSGRKIVFTNSPRYYAELVLRRLGLRPYVDALYSIEHSGYRAKPDIRAFRALLADARLHARRCIMVEDSARNLRPAKRLGMRTAWVSRTARRAAWIDCRARSVRALLHGSVSAAPFMTLTDPAVRF
jgi:putative hydrolase of the HAD superfamily